MEQNIKEAKYALLKKPMFATTAESFLIMNEIKSDFSDLPQPLRFSKMLSVLLSRVSTPIEPYDIIAGRTIDRELTDGEEAEFQAFIKDKDYPYKRIFLSSGHCTYCWEDLIKLGIGGLKARAVASLNTIRPEEEKIFLQGMIGTYEAIENYIGRYAAAAEKQGMSELAKTLNKIKSDAPDSFAEGLQLLWLITLIDCAYITQNPTLTLGRLDQILFPLYEKDTNLGKITRDDAKKYITDYYCKHNLIMGRGEHQVGDATNSTTFKRIFNFDAPQYLLLAGTDENGNSAVNDLTLLFAECIEPNFKNPVVVVRYYKNMNEEHPRLWKILVEKAMQSASLMFYNDNNMLATYKRMGLPEKDYRQYEHFGCNWPTPGYFASWIQSNPKSKVFDAYVSDEERKEMADDSIMRTNAPHGWPEDLLLVLKSLKDRDNLTIEDVYSAFFDCMGNFIDRKLRFIKKEVDIRARKPSAVFTFTDCFLPRSAERGKCHSADAKYKFQFMSFYMFGTVVDIFITVDKLVFIDKKLTLAELIEATEANFVGHERILALCRSVEKYGSDTPLSNYHAKRISKTATDMIIEKSRPYFENYGVFLVPCIQSDTWHLKLGEKFGATPDGRLAGKTFSQNIRPSNGASVNGISGMLNSVLNLPCDGVLSGALNLDINPKDFSGENGKALFSAMLASYFNRGGLHAQISAIDTNDLIEAQKDPDSHRDLTVRVTGYSGIFVDICKRLQDDIIERSK